jgi:phosphoglycolate phosphatase-like HAD superfamily hydrolase
MKFLLLLLPLVLISCGKQSALIEKPTLTHWNDGKAKTAIESFVKKVTTAGENFLTVEERVAVFDMDGTILIEKPNYVLMDFVLREMHGQMKADSSLKEKQPYKAIATSDWHYFETVDMFSDTGLYSALLYATDSLTEKEYNQKVSGYLNSVKDKRFGVSYDELVYAPVVELIRYLQAYQFEVHIVSGSDPQFTRVFCEQQANIPVENVIGTVVLTEWNEEKQWFTRVNSFVKPINDEEGKPVNIKTHIGRHPVIAVGNSTGDKAMLNYSKTKPNTLQMIVNHDDDVREYSYKSEKMKKLCEESGWIEISMKKDFRVVFELK